MIVQIQILSNATHDVSPSLVIQIDSQRYLFNCGEGFQRFAIQHQVRSSRFNYVFLTDLLPSSTFGLPGKFSSFHNFRHDTLC